MIPDYPTIIILSIFGVYIYARNLELYLYYYMRMFHVKHL